MIDSKTIYPLDGSELPFYITNYMSMRKAFGDVVVSNNNGEYSGNSWFLLKKDGKYGYLAFAWNSCSGCDMLQHCEGCAELQELANQLGGRIKWFDSAKECLDWMGDHNWEDDYSYSPKFVNNASAYLQSAIQVAKREWVSVEDRLPILGAAKQIKVVVYTERGLIKTCLFRKWDNARYFTVNGVTHWMPLPEPPKKEGCQS